MKNIFASLIILATSLLSLSALASPAASTYECHGFSLGLGATILNDKSAGAYYGEGQRCENADMGSISNIYLQAAPGSPVASFKIDPNQCYVGGVFTMSAEDLQNIYRGWAPNKIAISLKSANAKAWTQKVCELKRF